jgi:hypothetical protein
MNLREDNTTIFRTVPAEPSTLAGRLQALHSHSCERYVSNQTTNQGTKNWTKLNLDIDLYKYEIFKGLRFSGRPSNGSVKFDFYSVYRCSSTYK